MGALGICCTGAFIAEMMLSVIMNEDIWEIFFNYKRPILIKHLYQTKQTAATKFVPLHIPTVLSHYIESLRNTEELKTPQLKRLSIDNLKLQLETPRSIACGSREHSSNDMLKCFEETR